MDKHARIEHAQRGTGPARGQIDAMAALNHLNKLKQVKELKRTQMWKYRAVKMRCQ